MLLTLKILGLLTSCVGIIATYRTFPSNAARSKMFKAFKIADISITKKTKKREIKTYPTIKKVNVFSDKIIILFNIPDGINPDIIEKHEWLFKQKFGEHIEITQMNSKQFILSIYKQPIRQFDYNYDDITNSIKNMNLPILVGQSRSGIEAYDMTKYPHLLIAGETGSGKSTQLRSILSTLIHSDSNKLKIYLADLKRSEFHLFKGIANKVVYDADELIKILRKIKKELTTRGELLEKSEVANIEDLHSPPPYILLGIDEVALLKKEDDIMEIIEEISAIGRALGVYLILSMQRPDASILDGKLKNNLTVRMAFRHSDEINSRITLGSGDAANIKQTQKGLMCFKLDGIKKIQAPYLELKNAKRLLAPYKNKSVEENDQFQESSPMFGALEFD
ncbi:FtsK/SpoIIIE domain-containing protein [Chengkuizengella marina]|uniref:FtsK domain-containing protein n=1 Tax=Chengkuizengella marina TaxID=2507566 RepID=A0A6N9Q0H3_9BACL|nr:FtsK/SpoIIIE domain-containing protein [Chengkuizengella marina]NBI28622.1 hypothetical protein [Chengkuizengella marina]